MMDTEPLALRGFLADSASGAGLGGLRVELWDAAGARPVATARSDESGAFVVRLPPATRGQGAPGAEAVELLLRVKDHGRLLHSEVRALPREAAEARLELHVPAGRGEERAPTPDVLDGEVWGRVKGPLPEGARVEAALATLEGGALRERTSGEAHVDASGWYRVRFRVPAEGAADASLRVRVRDGAGALQFESAPILAPGHEVRVDVRLPLGGRGASEYALLEERAAELAAGSAAVDGLEPEALEEVAEWLEVETEQLELLQRARRLGAETGVPAPWFYALGRSGAPVELAELVHLPAHGLRTTLEEAAAAGVIELDALADLDEHLARLTARAAEAALAPEAPPGAPGLADVLAAADLPAEAIRGVLGRYQARPGGEAEFWEVFTASELPAEGAGPTTAAEVEAAVALAGLVGPDPALLRRLHALRREGRWRAPQDLAGWSFEDWCELLESLEPPASGEDGAEPAGEAGAGAEGQAEAIMDALEAAYPGACIRRELLASEELGAGARRVLERAPGHDLLGPSIRARAAAEPGLLAELEPGEAEAALEEIEAVERLSRVTTRPEEVALLFGTGMRSALDIAATPRRHFVEVFGEALGGRPHAARVHAEAQQSAASVRLAALRLLQSLQQTPFVLGGGDLKDIPDAQALFGSVGLCACKDCNSVYSPAAYLVDLLRYLNIRDPKRLQELQERLAKRGFQAGAIARLGRYRPLDVLLARRPDLAELPLTCENTLTPLPYIDLVNELLESRITGRSAAFDTGRTPADVLRAVPQHVDRDAYRRLQEAVHPLSLPFHEPLAVARAYLAHLGVPRLELLRALGASGAAGREALLVEGLGMSPEEYAQVARPPAEPWRHLGFDAAATAAGPYLAAVSRAPALLAATGIAFPELVEVAATRFLNADGALALESPAADCDPEKITIAGLDEPRLVRLLRLIRLRRRLGWSFTDLDRALRALGATDLGPEVLEKLTEAGEVARRLDRPIAEVLVLWAPLDTWGPGNSFDALLSTRAVAWRTQDVETFQLRPDRSELVRTGDSLDPVAAALLAAFRITSEELDAIRALLARRAAPPRLDLAGLSAVQRVALLARALRLRVSQLDALLRLTGPEEDPLRAGDPAATRRFLDVVAEVQGTEFTPERLLYLFRHEADPRRDPAPLPAQVRAQVVTLRRALVDAAAEAAMPPEPTGDTLRQKLGMLLEAPLLGPVMDALDPRTPLAPAERRRLFDQHLARLFPDPPAAAARLFGPVPPSAGVAAPAAPVEPTSVTPSPATPGPAPAAAAPPTAPAPPVSPAVEAGGAVAPPTAGPAAAAPSAPAPPAAPPSALDARWQDNVRYALAHVLPALRERLTRGVVVQTLSDGLGTSAAATAQLVERILRSRRLPGAPLLQDFLSLVGSGLTGSYHADPELRGRPVMERVDPELSFAWAGAPPAPGLPPSGYGVRWVGHLAPRSGARHVFYVRTDGAVRLVVRAGGAERVLLDHPGQAGRILEHASEPIALEAGELCALGLEYRNVGGPGHVTVEFGTSPAARGPLATADLFPAGGLSSFGPVEASYRRLHKAAMLLTGFGATDAQLAWLAGAPPWIDLDALPSEPGAPGLDAAALFRRWRHLAALYALRRKLPRAGGELFDVFRAASAPEALERLVAATGWDRATVEAFLGPQGFALDPAQGLRPAESGEEPAILRLARAVEVQRRIGVSPATLFAWARGTPDADAAAAIVQAVKARYDERRWLEVAQALNDPLRAARRDALVGYLLPRLRPQGVRTRSQLFEFFLIDVEMSPCMLTSRVRQAIGAVQTFFQRCLMNLEANVHPRLIDDADWKWLKSYRVWEANRKVFLYPENWIEPELRDDKSPLFQELERAILQQEIKKENVEAAFSDYLDGLDEIGRLDVRGVWFERRAAAPAARRGVGQGAPSTAPRSPWDEGTYHVFARTFNAPHEWYYRRLESGRRWTAWEKVEADVEGDHLVPVMYQRRMHLFWTVFREATKPPPAQRRDAKGVPPPLGKDWEIHLAYAVHDRGRWSRKRLSSGGAKDVQRFLTHQREGTALDGSGVLRASDYTLRAVAGEEQLRIYLYRRGVDALRTGAAGATAVVVKDADVEPIARFELDGSNGELVLAEVMDRGRVTMVGAPPIGRKTSWIGRAGNRRRKRPARAGPSPAGGAFRLAAGGLLAAPPGYRVSGTGFVPSGHAGLLLALPAPQGGVAAALGAPRGVARGARVVPVVDAGAPPPGLAPFFYQDRLRSYFARPVFTGWKPPMLLALPLVGRAATGLLPRFGRKLTPRPTPAARRTGRAREALEGTDGAEGLLAGQVPEPLRPGPAPAALLPELAPEALDAWEDALDEAWHPDDADEASPRARARPAPRPGPARAAAARAAPARPAAGRRPAVRALGKARLQVVRRGGYHEQRLRFTPFEHPATGRLLRTLKAQGIEGLLALATSRPARGVDHDQDAHGKWILRRPTWFERRYAPGPLVDVRVPPHLDIDFDDDGPYSLYNWELFFHAPLQVAVRLAKDGRHDEAQRWFHFIFDPTTDVSTPAPQRYWRFAPFHENTEYAGAREMMALLSYAGDNQELLRRQATIRDQVTAWWEKPFSPHVIARLRISAYQKAVVMKYIDNLLEWGDKLFRQDTMESIQEATQLYLLAGNILGRRPEPIPPLVEPRPATFAQVREKLDVFSNWEVRLENGQVRRPFRLAAQPDPGAATAVLGMATQYFCTPPNPQMDRYWDTVADRLFKIRNCMNIQGVVRQLALFEPPIDPGLLVRAAAAGVDLGSVAAALNAPPPAHRFRLLLQRAVRLAEELRTFGDMTLRALERKDAEALAGLRATCEAALREAIRDVHKKRVRQVEEEAAEVALEKEHVELQIQHTQALLQQLMNPQEDARHKSLTAGQVVSALAEGADLVSKVLYAIPDFQTGAAGAFSSPFVTLQLGGQMFGDISAAVAESFQKVMSRSETEAELAAVQAEYQRRREEWQHELALLQKEKARLEKRSAEIQVKLDIAGAELRRHDLEVENARKVEVWMREKYTSGQLYGWMLGQLSGLHFQAYKVAFDAAQQAERAFRFERGEPGAAFVSFSYWDSLKKGLLSGERLLLDLRRMEAAHLEGDRRALEIVRHVSLRDDQPAALQELLATGKCQVEVTEALLDGDFPGHYFRRLKSASLTVRGGFDPQGNVHCTLTLLENRVRKDANASGSYAQAEDADDPRFLVNVAPIHAVATSRAQGDAGMFELRFEDDRYLPFEGAGAISVWRIDLHQADNAADLSELTDVVLSLSYTARTGGGALEAAARASREKGLARGGLRPPLRHALSLRRDAPELWRRLGEAAAGQELEAALPVEPARRAGRLRGLDVRVERVSAFAHPRRAPDPGALRLRLTPPQGSGALLAGWAPPWAGGRVVRATAEISGGAGAWKVALAAGGARVPEAFDDVVLVFDLAARKV